jgi:hypothetical protein
VPGDPPVPITVWRTPASDDGGLLGHPLAARLVAAYTRRGDTVLDATTPAGSTQASGDPVLAGGSSRRVNDGHICRQGANTALADWDMPALRGEYDATVAVDIEVAVAAVDSAREQPCRPLHRKPAVSRVAEDAADAEQSRVLHQCVIAAAAILVWCAQLPPSPARAASACRQLWSRTRTPSPGALLDGPPK